MEQFRYRNRQIAILTHSLSLKGSKGNIHTVFHELPILHHCINLSVKKIFMVLDLGCSPLLLLSRAELTLLDASSLKAIFSEQISQMSYQLLDYFRNADL